MTVALIFNLICVAPLAGAWIEMSLCCCFAFSNQSLPLRERGLKSTSGLHDVLIRDVAPLAGAWIEITPPTHLLQELASLPLRERGLKCLKHGYDVVQHLSLPLRERGLK